MRQVFMFNLMSLDGYMAGSDGDLSWHNVDAEFNEFAIAQLDTMDTLLFGRVTYEMMASWWPTAEAIAGDPEVAGRMNAMTKIVFSQRLTDATWSNTRLARGDPAAEVRQLKAQPGMAIGVFGSGQLGQSLLAAGLLDELRVLVNPVLLGGGIPLFPPGTTPRQPKLLSTRPFHNGNVLLTYEANA